MRARRRPSGNQDTEIIFTRYDGVDPDLWVAGADGSNPRVWDTVSGGPFATADGSKLAYWNLYDVDGDGSEERCYLLIDFAAETIARILCRSGLSRMHWHPDGDRWVGLDHGRAVTVTVPGEEVTYYDQLPGYAGMPSDVGNVHIAPDGIRLAYERQPETIPPLNQIFVWQNGAELQLTDDLDTICRAPRWSPDGTRIAYYATERSFFTDSIEIFDVPVTPTREGSLVGPEAPLPALRPRRSGFAPVAPGCEWWIRKVEQAGTPR